VVRIALIGQTAGKATKIEQRRLKLTATDEVLRISRVRYLDDERASFETVVLPLNRFPGMSRDEVVASEITEVAQEFGVVLGLARERVSTVRAGRAVAGHLDVREGAHLLKLDRITQTAGGAPIEWRVSLTVPNQP
jgi:GntR family transcriptional regulator